jgi:hypothetical protein
MPKVQVEAHLSTNEMLKAARQLSVAELGRFLADIFALWAQRQNPRLTAAEAKLLQKIQQPVPADVRRRYRDLIRKRQAEALTPAEYQELLRLTKQVETADVARLRALVKLAGTRGSSLAGLMQDIGVGASGDV